MFTGILPHHARNFYPRSPCGERRGWTLNINGPMKISIHALLAESDVNKVPNQGKIDKFLSTLSLRRATKFVNLRVLDCSFLSTLSLRRATFFYLWCIICLYISIHALLAESDAGGE